MSRDARWYVGLMSQHSSQKRAPIQIHRWKRDERPTLPDELVRLASAEYNRQGFSQSHERLCERGGLGDIEIICLLADALEHERATAERKLREAVEAHISIATAYRTGSQTPEKAIDTMKAIREELGL